MVKIPWQPLIFIATMATQDTNTIMEGREELMVPLKHTKNHNPTRKKAHFLKPFSLNPSTSTTLLSSVQKKTCSLNVSFNGWRTSTKDWKSWVDSMHSLHKSTWKKAGIYEAVLNSKYEIMKHDSLILGLVEKWCHETNTFVFKWGEVAITLEDMMVIGGYSVLGESVVHSSRTENQEFKSVLVKLNEARAELNKSKHKKATQFGWMKKFKDNGSEIEHEAFLIYWLSRFVFPSSYDVVVKNLFTIAVHLARGVKLALAPAILATIYRDLKILKAKIVKSTDDTSVTVWAPFQIVQIWIWERFSKIRPNPGCNCKPRFSKWDQKKLQREDGVSIVDCALEDFCWQPYGMDLNDDLVFRNVYQETGRWVVVGNCLDEEWESWARCLRVSELVGVDDSCIEQYLPHRVAMQFGMNQDVPDDVERTNKTAEIAWRFYTRAVKDVKLYFPSRFSEPYVTTRYLEWRNKSTGATSLQSPVDYIETEKYVEEEDSKGGDNVDASGMELEDRITKLEEVFAYLKAKKN